MHQNSKSLSLISLSLIFFIILDLISFSQTVDQIKPAFFLLSFIYWNIAIPERMNLFFVFFFGFLMDFIQGTVLGLYPLILVSISYLSQRFFYQFRPLKFIQQTVVIFLIFLVIRFMIAVDLNDSNPSSLTLADKEYVLLSVAFALVNSIFWIPLVSVHRIYRRKFIKPAM
jgi:rod shape-determining protein MreD